MNKLIAFLSYWLLPAKKEEAVPLSQWEQLLQDVKAIDSTLPRRSHSFDLSSVEVPVLFISMDRYHQAIKGAITAITTRQEDRCPQFNYRPTSVKLDQFFITENGIYIESAEAFESFLKDCVTFLTIYKEMESEEKVDDFYLIRVLKVLSNNVKALFKHFHKLS